MQLSQPSLVGVTTSMTKHEIKSLPFNTLNSRVSGVYEKLKVHPGQATWFIDIL